MISKNQIKLIRSLKLKKYRQKYNKFICEGAKIIGELLSFRPELLDRLYMTPSGLEKLSVDPGDVVEVIDEKTLGQMSQLSNNTDGLALVDMPSSSIPEMMPFQFYLDGVRDPGNLGTIIRICDWFGIKGLWLSPDCVDVHNPKTVQSTMGSLFRVDIAIIPLERIIEKFQPEVMGADMKGDNYLNVTFAPSRPTLMVLGNEAQGISDDVREHLSSTCAIPRIGEHAESLNVAVSAGILAAHFTGK